MNTFEVNRQMLIEHILDKFPHLREFVKSDLIVRTYLDNTDQNWFIDFGEFAYNMNTNIFLYFLSRQSCFKLVMHDSFLDKQENNEQIILIEDDLKQLQYLSECTDIHINRSWNSILEAKSWIEIYRNQFQHITFGVSNLNQLKQYQVKRQIV